MKKRKMKKGSDVAWALARSKRSHQLVEIWRNPKLDRFPLVGYILDYSRGKHVLVHKMSDDVRLDGYVIVNASDIVRIETKPIRGDFFEKVLKKRGSKAKLPEGIDLSEMNSALRSVNSRFPLIAIFRESKGSGCAIGKIESLGQQTVRIHWLTPSAEWDGLSPNYRLKDITKISFGGEYEKALAMVAPPIKSTAKESLTSRP